MGKSEKCALDHASTNVSSISGSKNGRTNREEGDEAAALVRDTPWAFEVDTKAWVHVVQTQLRECISLSVRHGYHFFALLGAVDWLCFEMDLSTKVDGENESSENGSPDVAACARTRITPSLAEAVTATKAIVKRISGGQHLLPVKLAMNLVRRYNEADLLAASPSGAQAGTDMWANAMKKERQRKKSKTHMLLRDEPNGEVDLAEPDAPQPESMDLTTVDIRHISAACGVTDGRFIERRFRANDSSTHRRSSSGGEGINGGGGGAASPGIARSADKADNACAGGGGGQRREG